VIAIGLGYPMHNPGQVFAVADLEKHMKMIRHYAVMIYFKYKFIFVFTYKGFEHLIIHGRFEQLVLIVASLNNMIDAAII
jgi:hypothetical protein